MIFLRRRRLSIVKILPRNANQLNTMTLDGIFNFQILYKGFIGERSPDRAAKKEDIEKIPSLEAVQILQSSSSGRVYALYMLLGYMKKTQ